jgi:uncharacterized membrane protein
MSRPPAPTARPRRNRQEKPPAAETPALAPASAAPARRTLPIQGIFAGIGALVFVVLNVVTDGKVPGGYQAGVIGGTIGWLVGIGVERLLARRRS